MPDSASLEIRDSTARFVTDRAGMRTLHSFSYGDHYDPDNIDFGPLLAINEEQLAPGAGYDAHRHSDVEIVTWVLEGELTHEDTTGQGGTIRPGVAQRLSAGTGAEHAERNASSTRSLRFVQMMLRPHRDALFTPTEPAYESIDVAGTGLLRGVTVGADAELWIARPAADRVVLPDAPRLLVHVTTGRIEVAGSSLGPGDELRAVDAAGLELSGDGEALVWRLDLGQT